MVECFFLLSPWSWSMWLCFRTLRSTIARPVPPAAPPSPPAALAGPPAALMALAAITALRPFFNALPLRVCLRATAMLLSALSAGPATTPATTVTGLRGECSLKSPSSGDIPPPPPTPSGSTTVFAEFQGLLPPFLKREPPMLLANELSALLDEGEMYTGELGVPGEAKLPGRLSRDDVRRNTFSSSPSIVGARCWYTLDDAPAPPASLRSARTILEGDPCTMVGDCPRGDMGDIDSDDPGSRSLSRMLPDLP
mmetsp:Transcript_64692/g.204225  ORF Transcript_64692/g.204225 Transcript_64692/m.204225 type:complete len:253 (+) Transcript_64692:599-1357(+)